MFSLVPLGELHYFSIEISHNPLFTPRIFLFLQSQSFLHTLNTLNTSVVAVALLNSPYKYIVSLQG